MPRLLDPVDILARPDKAALIQEGYGRWTRYRLPAHSGSVHKDGHSLHKDDGSVHKAGDSVHKGRDGSVHKPDHSLHKGDYSLHKSDHSLYKGDHSLHKDGHSPHKDGHSPHKSESNGDEREHLIEIAAPARANRRLNPTEMERLIHQLCLGRWVSRGQLAELLQRNAEGLRARFIVPMVRHGLLRPRYPDTPHRADQAYTATGDPNETDQ